MIRKSILLLAGVLTAGLAQAGGNYYQHARVVDVRPEYRVERTPINREVCWEEDHYVRVDQRRNSRTGTIAGAIIGGVIGNQFGGGNGKRAATAAGVLLGGSIGRDADRRNRGPESYRQVTREQCRIERDYREESVATGYRVTYEYDGRLYHTNTRQHPGDTIRVRVDVRPAD